MLLFRAPVWGLCSGLLFGTSLQGHPELVSGSGFLPLSEGRSTVDGQRCLHSDQRVLGFKRRAVSNARSRAGTSRDDKVSGFRGRFYGMTEEAPIRSCLRDNSPSRHSEMLLFRIWAWVSAKDGSMIRDEGLLLCQQL